MYNINWHITIGNYKLLLLESAEVHASVDLLADTATIELPGSNLNKKLDVEAKIKLGDKVLIEMGYNDDLLTEFEGYVERIGTDDGTITLNCEDGIYLTRKPITDKVLKLSTVKDVAQYIASEIGGFTVECDYNFTYDKFVISRATGYDVLKKLQEETKANIYMLGDVLHIHPAYIEKFGDVTYDFARNIEKSDLTYKRADERKFEIEVEGIMPDSKRVTEIVGTPGGDRRTIKMYGVSDKASLKARGEEELKRLSYDGYEGSITCWLLPVCRPGYSAKIIDVDYPEKEGGYYVVAVTTLISQGGGVRKVQLGKRLS
jgi:hypothetical protein